MFSNIGLKVNIKKSHCSLDNPEHAISFLNAIIKKSCEEKDTIGHQLLQKAMTYNDLISTLIEAKVPR